MKLKELNVWLAYFTQFDRHFLSKESFKFKIHKQKQSLQKNYSSHTY